MNSHKKAKIKKLKKESNEDAVWTMKDNSFINLIYELKSSTFKQNNININFQHNKNNEALNYTNLKPIKKIVNEDNQVPSTGTSDEKNNYNTTSTKNLKKFSLKTDFSIRKLYNKDDNSALEIKKLTTHKKLESSNQFKKNNSFLLNNSSKYNLDSHEQTLKSSEISQESYSDFSDNYHVLEDNYTFTESNNIYSKEYLLSLNQSEYEYDTFCQCVIISGLKTISTQNMIPNSENIISICSHKDCSLLPSFKSSVICHYQNKQKTEQIKITDLIADFIFPLGIKICFIYDEIKKYPECKEPIMNIILNEKGDKYYMVSLIYYKITNVKKFQEKYKVNLINKGNNIDEYNLKINLNKKNITNDTTILLPESISLVSKFPFINQMSQCLKTIISLKENNKSNSFINHIINQVPVPSKNQKIKFYTPISPNPLKLVNPFILNSINYTPENIFVYFSVDNIITIFYLCLLEQQLLFIDDDHNLLSSISYLFSNLTYPISWIDTYIPILSLSSVSFLQSIVPFIMGSNEYLAKYAVKNSFLGDQNSPRVIPIHIRNDAINFNVDELLYKKKSMSRKNILKYLELPQIPEGIEKFLVKKLTDLKKLIIDENGNSIKSNYIKLIQNVFCDIMVVILSDYKKYFFIIDDNPIFNKEAFIAFKKNEDKAFYKEFAETQSFMQFLQIENKEAKKRKIQKKNLESMPKYGYIYDNNYVDHSFFYSRQKILNAENNKEATTTTKKKRSIFFSDNKLNDSPNINDITDNNDNTESNFSVIEALKLNNINSVMNKKENELHIILMPYFFKEYNKKLDKNQKIDYIQNQMNQLLGIDNEIEKILNIHNYPYYILPSYKRYNFNTIIDDNYQKYFVGSINKNNHYLTNNLNRLYSSIINSETNDNDYQKEPNLQTIDNWFGWVCSPNKIKKCQENDVLNLINNRIYRKYFIELLFQNYLTSDNFLKFIIEQPIYNLAIIVNQILNNITENEYYDAKLVTLACVNYYSYNINTGQYFLLIDRIKQYYPDGIIYCIVWNSYDFWRLWLKDDFQSKEIDDNNLWDENLIYNYNDCKDQKIEYIFIYRIGKIMQKIGLKKTFVEYVIFQNLGQQFLTTKQLSDLRFHLNGD